MCFGSGFVPAVLSLVGISLTTGCSWLFVQPLPARPSVGDYGTCTTSRAAPVVDTIFTLTNVASAIYVAGQDNVTNKGTAVSIGLAVATLWFSSAYYGYSKTSECEEARGEPRSRYVTPLASPPRRVAPRPAAPAPAPAPPDAAPLTSGDASPAVAPAPTPASAPAAPQQEDSDEPGRQRPRGPPPPHPD